ncbi:MAG: flagellar basal body L-ring protein FlgH [Acetobacteraceae bacterium]|nr:flagellar basal body L-ring protein FlgH [Acetobacteraceae bacterium]
MKLQAGLALPLALLLSGCGTLGRLSEIGRPPEMSKSADPTKEANYRPMTMPMPTPQTAAPQIGSLWRTGSRAFFKDQRAAQVGDLLTVLVNATDTADVQNGTTSTRTGVETMGVPNLLGLESALPHLLPGATASSLLSATSTNSNNGTGEIKRADTVTLRLAGVVTQVLPNGNLVVAARQEMLVNSELRQLLVTGVVRPQDIASDNTVTHDRMAEARIAYGGRGQLTDLQTARWGQQIVDILAPF